MVEDPRNQLIECLKKSAENGDFSDLTIVCGNDTYQAHKIILCARSAFFAKAMRFPGKEAEEGRVDLSDDDPTIIKLFMQYCYEAEYHPVLMPNCTERVAPHTCGSSRIHNAWAVFEAQCTGQVCVHHTCGVNCANDCVKFFCKQCHPCAAEPRDLSLHAQMYALADKYEVIGLKDLATRKLTMMCLWHWDDEAFANAAWLVFSTTPDNDEGMRTIISKEITKNMSLLLKPEIKAVLTEFGDLSYRILVAKAKENKWVDGNVKYP